MFYNKNEMIISAAHDAKKPHEFKYLPEDEILLKIYIPAN
jgi:hypothetical protein